MLYDYISSIELESLKSNIDILLVTATEVETAALHMEFKPLMQRERVLACAKGIITYYIGRFGLYNVCHVESEMGSLSSGGSIMTIQQSIGDWDPKAIIMIGIAFGKDLHTQRIGDVLIADMVLQYETKKVGKKETIYRGPKSQSSKMLLNRFKNYSKGWVFETGKNELNERSIISSVLFGNILSGEVLIDNKEYSKQLFLQFPTAIGGEMEGVGLAATAHAGLKHWILVKGICDFADGNKSINKQANQVLAAASAVSLCKFVFNNKYTFEELGIAINVESNTIIRASNPNEVLFNVYKNEYESYYIERLDDILFSQYLVLNKSVWIYGKSGVGKTNLAFRNLINSNRKFNVIDCSNCFNMNFDQTLGYIYAQLLIFANQPSSFVGVPTHEVIDHIVKLIHTSFPEDTCVIFEEMPISPDDMTFAGYMFSIFIKLSNTYPDSKVVFVCTSLGDPKALIKTNYSKITEKVKFINISEWRNDKLEQLCSLVNNELQLGISIDNINNLLLASGGTPRFVKNFFWNFIAFNSKLDFEEVLKLTKSETEPYAN